MAKQGRVDQSKLVELFENPASIRDSFLENMKLRGGRAKLFSFEDVRDWKMHVDNIGLVTLHTLLHYYSVYKHNALHEDDPDICFTEAQDTLGIIQSNRQSVKELFNLAGLGHSLQPMVSDFDLHDPCFLREFLLSGKYEGSGVSKEELNFAPIQDFRRTLFRENSTGFELRGHSLMLYHSALYYVKGNPDISFKYTVETLKLGKSNKKVRNTILENAGLKT